MNFFWLLYYVTENAARQNHVTNAPRTNRVWFDNIVVSTAYVGPISAKRGEESTPGARNDDGGR